MPLPAGQLSAKGAKVQPIGSAAQDGDKGLPVRLAPSKPQLVEGLRIQMSALLLMNGVVNLTTANYDSLGSSHTRHS
jgi:hypothetical protein